MLPDVETSFPEFSNCLVTEEREERRSTQALRYLRRLVCVFSGRGRIVLS